MRIERVKRWPAVPRWALLLTAIYLSLVGLWMLAGRSQAGERPELCLFRRLTGWPCPSCGTTRSLMALANGELRQAIAYNPLAVTLCVAALGLLILRLGFRRRIVWITSPTSRRCVTAALILVVLANWLYVLTASM
jgi:hypothetical protein